MFDKPTIAFRTNVTDCTKKYYKIKFFTVNKVKKEVFSEMGKQRFTKTAKYVIIITETSLTEDF